MKEIKNKEIQKEEVADFIDALCGGVMLIGFFVLMWFALVIAG